MSNDHVAVPHEGRKPDWLEDDAVVTGKSGKHSYSRYARGQDWTCHEAYLLPADHWAAPVILAGLTPWNPALQGEGPPSDYAGGKVMWDEKDTIRNELDGWKDPFLWSFTKEGTNITGYEPASDPCKLPAPSTTPDLEAEVARLRAALEKAAGWFEDYAAEHYAKAKTAPDYREQHGREVKGKTNSDRASELRTALSGDRS